MTEPATSEVREAYVDLEQRYRCLYGIGLQTRLATQRPDITAWWRMGMPSLPRPAPKPREPVQWGDLPDKVREVIRAVAAEHGVPVEKVVGFQQLARYAQARKECYRRLHRLPWRGDHPSQLQIGMWLHRDHTTINHGLK